MPAYDGDENELDLAAELAEHLADDQVAIMIEVANAGLKSLYGEAIAVNDKGTKLHIDLEDIYAQAKAAFGIEPTRAAY